MTDLHIISYHFLGSPAPKRPEESKHAVVALAMLSWLSQSHVCPLHCSINFHNLALEPLGNLCDGISGAPV